MITRSKQQVAIPRDAAYSVNSPAGLGSTSASINEGVRLAQQLLTTRPEIKQDNVLTAQPAVKTPCAVDLPSSSTSPETTPSPNTNHSTDLEHKSGIEKKVQGIGIQHDAAPSRPQVLLTSSPSPPLLEHHQAVPTLVLELDSNVAKPRKMSFRNHSPAPATVKFWKENHHNAKLYGVRLLGSPLQPDEVVGIDLKDLILHSEWFAGLHKSSTVDSARHSGSTAILVPLQTPYSVVTEMVQALYHGKVSLRHDNVEPLLLLSHAMQVSLVQSQCRKYLLDLDLPLQQLQQLALLWMRLGLQKAFKNTLQTLMYKPWLDSVMQTVSAVFKHLISGDVSWLEMATDILQCSKCGSMCELQVLDMLLAAGASFEKPLLPSIFRVGRLNDCTFSLLENYLRPNSLPLPSSQLLIDIASRAAQFSSWSGACQTPREDLILISLGEAVWASRSATFHCQGYALQVELPSAVAQETGGSEYKLTLLVEKPQSVPQDISVLADQMVLYLITDSAPAVTPMCQWDISTGASEWLTQCCATWHDGLQIHSPVDHDSFLGLRLHKH